MVFSSLAFLLVYLPFALGLYFLTPRRGRNAALLCLSLLFYAWGEPVYVLLMIFSTLADYTCGRLLARWDGRPGLRRLALGLSLAANLGLLLFFKYAGLFARTLAALTGWPVAFPALALPIGISFYTFQTLSYTIDVYRRACPAQRNLIDFGCYVTLFPQLIAGPIVRYVTVQKELMRRRESIADLEAGMRRFVAGLCKKVLLANGIGQLWESMRAAPAWSALGAWLGILAFAFQIYFDFSGYSDMAVGLGRIFGFRFPENFHYPYLSRSITDFWRRWHITLSTWFREYVYIPLGGNRVSRGRNVCNLLAVWLLTGLWHGASWNFLLWGGYFGVLLVLEKFVLGAWLARRPAVVGWLYTFAAVLIGWVLFAFEAMPQAAAYLRAMLGFGGVYDATALYALYNYGASLALCALAATPLGSRAASWLERRCPKGFFAVQTALCVAGLCLCILVIVDSSYNPFLYFRF